MNELIKKLKVENYKDKLVLHKPAEVSELDGLIFDSKISKKKYDLIFVFIFSSDEFAESLQTVIDKDLLNPDGYACFVYPKKGNKVYKTCIGRDDFFGRVQQDDEGYINGSSVKFAKMVAFNDVFTLVGLKHQAARKSKASQPSGCVTDYIDRIPDIQSYLASDNEIADLYNSLTPGYRRDWARYVYSAKSDETVAKRLLEMKDILRQGYKSKDLYRQGKK